MSSNAKIRTLMVDDSPEFLAVAKRFLGTDPTIEVVEQIKRGTDVVPAIQQHAPKVVLLDLAMPDKHGFDVLKEINKTIQPPPCVIVLTLHDNPEYRANAEALGADGFIYKSNLGMELLPMIHKLSAQKDRTNGTRNL